MWETELAANASLREFTLFLSCSIDVGVQWKERFHFWHSRFGRIEVPHLRNRLLVHFQVRESFQHTVNAPLNS